MMSQELYDHFLFAVLKDAQQGSYKGQGQHNSKTDPQLVGEDWLRAEMEEPRVCDLDSLVMDTVLDLCTL